MSCLVNGNTDIEFHLAGPACGYPLSYHFVKLSRWMLESPVDLRTDIIYICLGIHPGIDIYIILIRTGQIIHIAGRTDAECTGRSDGFHGRVYSLHQVVDHGSPVPGNRIALFLIR